MMLAYCTAKIFIFVNCLGPSRYLSYMDYKIKRRGIYIYIYIYNVCVYVYKHHPPAAAEEMNLYL